MQCLDDQSAYSLLNSPPNSTQPEWNTKAENKVEEVVNKVADRSSNSQRHFANCKAMSQRSVVTLRQARRQCPRFFFSSSAANLLPLLSVALVLLFAAAAFVESVALHSSSSPLHPEPAVDIAMSSPLQPVLALNSSVAAHGTFDDLHGLLTSLTDEQVEHDEHEEDFEASHSQESAPKTDSQSKVASQDGISQRVKREVSFNDESNTTKMPKNKNKSCYKKVLFRCGRTFVHSYKFVRVKNNDNLSDNDILVAQCTLRTAFFDCLKSKASNCNKRKANEMSGKVKRNGKKIAKHDDGLDVPGMEKTGKNSTTSTENFEKHLRSLRKRLAETIWDSRICIFKNSLKITPLPV